MKFTRGLNSLERFTKAPESRTKDFPAGFSVRRFVELRLIQDDEHRVPLRAFKSLQKMIARAWIDALRPGVGDRVDEGDQVLIQGIIPDLAIGARGRINDWAFGRPFTDNLLYDG